MKKRIAIAMMGLLMLGLWTAREANVAGIDWLGRVSALGGAEGESWRRKSGSLGGDTGALGLFEGMGVIPITPMFGLQFNGGVGGRDSFRLHFQGGPIMDFGMGKAGVFWGTQVRKYAAGSLEDGVEGRNNRIAWSNWVRFATAFYLPGTNIDFWVAQPFGGANRFNVNTGDHAGKRIVGLSEARLVANFFPAIIWRDNLEMSLGVMINGFSGPDNRTRGVPMGVGPVLGTAFMPVQNLEVQLFKASIDNRNRYRVTSGVQWYFNRAPATLLQLRRMYLEPTNLPGTMSSDSHDL
jgi:hypothetical protein